MREYILSEPPKEEDFVKIINDESNPMSPDYIRKLAYHKIKWIAVIINVSIFIIAILSCALTLWFTTNNILLTLLVSVGIGVLYILIKLRSVLIFMVEVYQYIAPKKIRYCCRYEPSCSEYTIQAIKKYGAYKGFYKGLKRISNCKYPNGGFDEP